MDALKLLYKTHKRVWWAIQIFMFHKKLCNVECRQWHIDDSFARVSSSLAFPSVMEQKRKGVAQTNANAIIVLEMELRFSW